MKTIHKFRIEPGKEPTTLSLTEGYRVVRCEYLIPDKAVYLWVEQPLNVGAPVLKRQFRVAFSGEPVPRDFEYIDTALDQFGPEAYHVFAVPAENQADGVEPENDSLVNQPLAASDW
ncbi:hypothetical protein [Marinobacter sp. 2_MG-2023]|uniref:DUF7352 domain-containing protein n=1 Tax=Marinobacter sp. 2_MG-2023 TaxID=3062679 RepID=UPI0026E3C1B0|nr:hypothetical protein [Marinobacter sp. 2_MG-2023]MDO6442188.1 hypothetical protein [Marinobacter sp. 2_MG-2023]